MSDAVLHTAARDRGQAVMLTLATLALLAINLQLWAFDTPPLIDWPNHLARHILQCGAPGAENIARYYAYALEIVPNLTSDLLHTLPLACADPELTQRLLIQVSSFGLLAATLVLHRAIWGAWSVWPLLAALVMHNMAWAYGFENFILAAPLPLLAIALWFALAERPALVRLGCLIPVAGVIYVCHLYAFGFLMMALGFLELGQFYDRRRQPGAIKSAGLSLALLVLMALGPAIHLASALAASPEVEAGAISHRGIWTLLETLLSPFSGTGNVLESVQTLSVAALLLAAFLLLPSLCRVAGAPIRIDRRAAFALWPLLAIALVVPNTVASVAFTNIRIPILFAPFLIAATRVDLGPRGAALFCAAVIAATFAKTDWIMRNWQVHEAEVAELRQAAQVLSEEDRVLALREGLNPLVIRHSHTPTYVLRDQGAYWRGLFTGGNSLSPRPAYAMRDHDQPFPLPWQALHDPTQQDSDFRKGGRLDDWDRFYTHAIVFFDPRAERPQTAAIGETLVKGSFFDLVRLDVRAQQSD